MASSTDGPVELQGPLRGYYGREGEVVLTGRCSACGQRAPLAAYDTREWIRLGPLPILPLGTWRVFDDCPLCGHSRRLPLDAYRAWVLETVKEDLAALERTPGDWATRLALGWRYYGLGCPHEAAALLVPTVEQPDAPPEVCHAAGVALAAIGRLEEAQAMLSRAVNACPEKGLYRLDLGRVLLRRGRDLKLAEEHLSAAAAALADDPNAWVTLARARTRLGYHQTAWHAWRKALALNPDLALVPGHAAAIERAKRRGRDRH